MQTIKKKKKKIDCYLKHFCNIKLSHLCLLEEFSTTAPANKLAFQINKLAQKTAAP